MHLIDYTTICGLEVVPEIDMPGHFTAAISAYNDLFCLGTTGWGSEFSDPICAGKTENYPMIKNIILLRKLLNSSLVSIFI